MKTIKNSLMKTIKNDKLFADFMGLKAHEECSLLTGIDNPYFVLDDRTVVVFSDWNGLMPVVNKIRSLYNYEKIGGTEEIEDLIDVLAQGCIEGHIEQVYESCTSIIKWYNQILTTKITSGATKKVQAIKNENWVDVPTNDFEICIEDGAKEHDFTFTGNMEFTGTYQDLGVHSLEELLALDITERETWIINAMIDILSIRIK